MHFTTDVIYDSATIYFLRAVSGKQMQLNAYKTYTYIVLFDDVRLLQITPFILHFLSYRFVVLFIHFFLRNSNKKLISLVSFRRTYLFKEIFQISIFAMSEFVYFKISS